MIVTTTPSVEGQLIAEYHGIVVGEAILGANVIRDICAGITDILGGRSGAYEEELGKARAVALQEADQTNMVTTWCAISDATVENGCLQIRSFSKLSVELAHRSCSLVGWIFVCDTAIPERIVEDQKPTAPQARQSNGRYVRIRFLVDVTENDVV